MEFWPLVTSILTWAKKWPKLFRNDFSRAFERRFPFCSTMHRSRDRRGGGGVQTPPPPAGRGKSRGPAGRGLTSLFAWKPPHDVAGINSSHLGGHSNAGVRTASTKLAPLAPELCSDTKYSEIIFHDACAVRIFSLLDDVTHYCVTSEVEDYFRKWYDGFRWFRPVCYSNWRRSLSREACVLWNETWEGLKLQKGFEYELSNTIVMSFILFSRFNSPHKGIRIRRTWPSPQAVEYSVKCSPKIFCRLVACYVIQYVTSHLV